MDGVIYDESGFSSGAGMGDERKTKKEMLEELVNNFVGNERFLEIMKSIAERMGYAVLLKESESHSGSGYGHSDNRLWSIRRNNKEIYILLDRSSESYNPTIGDLCGYHLALVSADGEELLNANRHYDTSSSDLSGEVHVIEDSRQTMLKKEDKFARLIFEEIKREK